MISERQYILGFILLIALGFSGWYYVQNSTVHYKKNTSNKPQADFYIYNMTSLQFDKNGKLSDKITSPKVTHYPKNNTSYLQQPLIYAQRNQQGAWHIKSDQGKAENGSDVVTLWGNVNLHQEASKENGTTTITTSKLTYYPKKKFAETHKAIQISQPGTVLNSVGMQAYLDQGRVKLLSRARGQYNPEIAKKNKKNG